MLTGLSSLIKRSMKSQFILQYWLAPLNFSFSGGWFTICALLYELIIYTIFALLSISRFWIRFYPKEFLDCENCLSLLFCLEYLTFLLATISTCSYLSLLLSPNSLICIVFDLASGDQYLFRLLSVSNKTICYVYG